MFQVPGQDSQPRPPAGLPAAEHRRLLNELRTGLIICSICLVIIVMHLVAVDLLMMKTLLSIVDAVGRRR